jgi:hypothetical protein
MTTAQEKRYGGLLKYLRSHIFSMSREGIPIPIVVAAELKRVRDEGKRRSV